MIKHLGTTFGLLLTVLGILDAQETVTKTLLHDGTERSYIIYVPSVYTAERAIPVVLNFHGYTSNASQQLAYGDFRAIADTAGFLVVHPQGLLDQNGITHWNADWGTGVDDIGFVDRLLDSLARDYRIDLSRVYSTGMSNGGYMSFTLACRLSSKIAAIASVTGSMTTLQTSTPSGCSPLRPVPILQIHGTNDVVVPYNGSTWSAPIADVLQFWIGHNGCGETPEIFAMPNLATDDRTTTEVQAFRNCNADSEVVHYKVAAGGHTWPGTRFPNGVTSQDYSASEEIWAFFSQYDINGRITVTSNHSTAFTALDFRAFPNPARNRLFVKAALPEGSEIRLLNAAGIALIKTKAGASLHHSLPVHRFQPGLYFVQVLSETGTLLGTRKVVIH